MRGNPHAAFDVAGAGNVAWSRCCDTRITERASKQGTQTSTYTGAPVLDPTENSNAEPTQRNHGEGCHFLGK